MTSFVHIEYPTQHPGVSRVGSAIDAAQQVSHQFSGTRGLATLLLSAMAAAVMVVAYEVMDTVAEGHLMVIWIAMWCVAFAVLALFAGTARQVALRLKAGLDGWSRSMAEARADERMMDVARSDARVMAELRIARIRAEVDTPDTPPAQTAQLAELPPVRRVKIDSPLLRAYHLNYI